VVFNQRFIHLKGGRQDLDEHRRLDGADRKSEHALGVNEDVVP
jgi:hypothetical protein